MMPEHMARRVRAHVLADPSAVGAYAADIVGRACARAVRARGVFTLALSGGSTPLHLFRRLSESERMNTGLDWQRVRVFWVDERCVPPEHADSNFGLAWRELFADLPHRPDLFRMRGEDAPEAAALAYERLLYEQARPLGDCASRHHAEGVEGRGGIRPIPRLDCVILGMGVDGHTASLFPGSSALEERTRLTVAASGPAPEGAPGEALPRLTLTLPVINAARLCLLMVCGAEKSAVLHRVLDAFSAPTLPAQQVRPCPGRLVALADRAAWGSESAY